MLKYHYYLLEQMVSTRKLQLAKGLMVAFVYYFIPQFVGTIICVFTDDADIVIGTYHSAVIAMVVTLITYCVVKVGCLYQDRQQEEEDRVWELQWNEFDRHQDTVDTVNWRKDGF